MRNSAAAVTMVCLFAPALHAGNDVEIIASGGPSFPLRGLERLVGIGYRIAGSVQFDLNENVGLVFTSGFMRWRFDSDRINAAMAGEGLAQGYAVRGPFQSVPVMLGARLILDGSAVRPYIGIMGGAYFLRWSMAGTQTTGGTTTSLASVTRSWTEPATSLDAGLLIALGGDLWVDLGGSYSAFSNSANRVDPAAVLGQSAIATNTASQVSVSAGFRLVL
ncbi:MAG: hypothetical protein AB1428_14400 [Bacteroidota bacterium]